MSILFILMGMAVVAVALFLIRTEYARAVKTQVRLMQSVSNPEHGEQLTSLRVGLDETNRAFYDIASDLEGKYSEHERRIGEIELELERLREIRGQSPRFSAAVETPIQTAPIQTAPIHEAPKARDVQGSVSSADEYRLEGVAERARRLSASGLSSSQIAKELGIGVGEVKLFLSLK